MRTPIILGLIAVASAYAHGIASGQAVAADSVAEREVRALRQALLDAGNRNDRAALERMIASGFSFVHSTGSIDSRERWIANAVTTTATPASTTEYPMDQIRVYGGDTAVWTTYSISRPQAGGPEVRVRSTNTYVKLGGEWQWAAGQSTRLPSRPAAATIDQRLYGDYVGQYEVGSGRVLTVSEEGSTLRGRLTGLLPAELIPRSETEFIWFNPENNVYSEMIFVRGQSGAVSHVLYRREGVEIWRAPKLPPPSPAR